MSLLIQLRCMETLVRTDFRRGDVSRDVQPRHSCTRALFFFFFSSAAVWESKTLFGVTENLRITTWRLLCLRLPREVWKEKQTIGGGVSFGEFWLLLSKHPLWLKLPGVSPAAQMVRLGLTSAPSKYLVKTWFQAVSFCFSQTDVRGGSLNPLVSCQHELHFHCSFSSKSKLYSVCEMAIK